MTFIIRESYNFKNKITIAVPDTNETGYQEQQIYVTFKLLEQKQIEQFGRLNKNKSADNSQLLEHAVINIEGLTDEKGEKIQCTAELKKRLLAIGFIFKPIADSYVRTAQGIIEKNSEHLSDSKLATEPLTLK